MDGLSDAGPLVSTDWLAARLGRPGLVVVDASWRLGEAPGTAGASFAKRRIPGAVHFDLDAVADASGDLPHMAPSADAFARAVAEMGVAPDDHAVVYDDAGIFSAPRVWLTFAAMGWRASVLDGGLPKWRAEGRPLDEAPPAAVVAARKAVPRISDVFCGAEAVRAGLADGETAVLDARPAARFAGRAPEPRPGLRGGAMPGAKSLPHAELLTDEGALKPEGALAAAFEACGAGPKTPTIATCGSGVTAAVLVLARARLGWRPARLYDGSWAEWGRDHGPDANARAFPVVADG
ncbi:MAG: sulfurtransferase [Parvularculaceae bacterium]